MRKSQATEGERLRSAYSSPAWAETHEKFEKFVLGQIRAGLDNPGRNAWATEDRFELGLASIQERYLPRCARERKPSAPCVVAVATK
jgi:hypothetical protein